MNVGQLTYNVHSTETVYKALFIQSAMLHFQDKNVWLSVIEMLKKKDKLPVVAFTFSKKRIEDNANHLNSVDLTTSTEKSEIHVFFQRCISRLKGSDKDLPQVSPEIHGS